MMQALTAAVSQSHALAASARTAGQLPLARRGGHAGPLLRAALVLLPALAAATTAAAQSDETPSGMVAFFMTSGVGCPPGWAAFAPASGRLLLAVANPQAVGVTQGSPMLDQTAPLHSHNFQTTVTIRQKEIEAERGSNNHDGARSDQTPAVPNNPPGTTNSGVGEASNLPFIQLMACEKQ